MTQIVRSIIYVMTAPGQIGGTMLLKTKCNNACLEVPERYICINFTVPKTETPFNYKVLASLIGEVVLATGQALQFIVSYCHENPLVSWNSAKLQTDALSTFEA